MKINRENSELRQTNWLKMVIDLIGPKNLYLVAGRGTGKTSDVLAERSQDIIHDMPGAPLAFVGDTYMNLVKNTVKTFIEGWERLGWREASEKQTGHFVTDKAPPSYFAKPYSRLDTYKHTLSTFNGCNFNLVSMDRPSSGAGNNYVHLVGDEVKYLKEHKLKKLTPAIRGNYVKFGHSPYFRGRTFTTDYPDVNDIREDNWILRMRENMDKKQILMILDCAFVLNEIRFEYYNAEKSQDPAKLELIAKKIKRWEERYYKIRKNSTLFYIASSMVNVDILTEGYFFEQFQDLEFEDYKTSILSMPPSLEPGARFYGNLSAKHFYSDGYNYDYYDRFGLRDNITQSSRGLRYIMPDVKLEAGVDFGNMIGMVIGQEQWPNYRCLKNIHMLTPEWIPDIAKAFTSFFSDHIHKELDMYYDRSANNFNKQKQDLASKLKQSIEKQEIGGRLKPTGWKVNLMSLGQGNITHTEEFDFMNDLMRGNLPGLPNLLIDQFECRELKSSLELAPVEKDTKGNIKKQKKSEKFPVKRLPMESTNYSDAFKYLMCRRKYLDVSKARRAPVMADPSWRDLK
ncbi:MAG: hypothetical protein ACOYN5_04505 [Bacteroidales bacterium]